MIETRVDLADFLDGGEESVEDAGYTDDRFSPCRITESSSKEELYEAIAQELRICTGNDLKIEDIREKETEKYTQITFVLNRRSDEPCSDRRPHERFFNYIKILCDVLAGGRRIHSTTHQPFFLTDAVFFILKINWESHSEEDEINVFDLTS